MCLVDMLQSLMGYVKAAALPISERYTSYFKIESPTLSPTMVQSINHVQAVLKKSSFFKLKVKYKAVRSRRGFKVRNLKAS